MKPYYLDNTRPFSYRQYAWRQFKRNKPALISFYILIIMLVVALLADLIANNQPLYAKYRSKVFYPAFTSMLNEAYIDSTKNPETGVWETIQFDITDWRQLDLDKVVWAPIPYSPQWPDKYNREYLSPYTEHRYKDADGKVQPAPWIFRHHLGTDQIGKDVASGIVHGSRISLRVGLIAMGIAGIIGIILGALAGFYGDTRLRTRRGKYWLVLLTTLIGFFYGFIVRKYALMDAALEGVFPAFGELLISLVIMGIFIAAGVFIGYLFQWIPWLNKRVTVPIDSYVSRTIEVLDSMPKLLIIISIAALFIEKSLFLVMAIIGITSWTAIARFTRAEFLRARNMDYVEAARALGYKDLRIMFRHALPNALAPVFIAVAFGIASAILVESSLSFLGIGVPSDVVTWGSLLSAGRYNFDAWWMVLYPGLAIFITVTVYNLIGEGLRDALDPRLKM